MPVTDLRQDPDAATLTVRARFDAAPEQVWTLWADARRLERWWGPPPYPATVVEHDLTPGGRVTYFMTGPDGDRHHGWWRVQVVDAPRVLVVEDGFADTEGNPAPDLPTARMEVTLTAEGDTGGTAVTVCSRFTSRAALEELVAMGMAEGLLVAMAQMDDVLAG